MTREDILAMKPGRELDDLVARKVMGWTYTRVEDGFGHPPGKGFERIPLYSTDIAAAWEVAEKTKLLEKYVLYENQYFGWSVSENDYGDLHSIGNGRTPQEAICKAALIEKIT